MKLVHWPLIGGLLYFVQRGGDWAGPGVPITVLLYNGPLLCGFNVTNKGLRGRGKKRRVKGWRMVAPLETVHYCLFIIIVFVY